MLPSLLRTDKHEQVHIWSRRVHHLNMGASTLFKKNVFIIRFKLSKNSEIKFYAYICPKYPHGTNFYEKITFHFASAKNTNFGTEKTFHKTFFVFFTQTKKIDFLRWDFFTQITSFSNFITFVNTFFENSVDAPCLDMYFRLK